MAGCMTKESEEITYKESNNQRRKVMEGLTDAGRKYLTPDVEYSKVRVKGRKRNSKTYANNREQTTDRVES